MLSVALPKLSLASSLSQKRGRLRQSISAPMSAKKNARKSRNAWFSAAFQGRS
jgi:hypothetical protein